MAGPGVDREVRRATDWQICEELEISLKGKTCKAMEGLVKEAAEVIEEDAAPEVKDAALIAAAQRVEHYEMAGYGCVRKYAKLLGNDKAAYTAKLWGSG